MIKLIENRSYTKQNAPESCALRLRSGYILNSVFSGCLKQLFFLLIIVFGFTTITFGQERTDSTVVDPTEALLEQLEDEDAGGEDLIEILAGLKDNPIEINSATADEFALIPGISWEIGDFIVRFRDQFGAFNSIPELRSIEGITENVYFTMRPYITIGEKLDIVTREISRFPEVPDLGYVLKNLQYDVLQRYSRRLNLGPGYSDDTTRTTYDGSPERLYTRFKIKYRRNVSINLTMDKDPGEVFQWNPDTQTYGYDFVSGHAAIRNMGRIKTFVVGDFVTNFGQGVALWRASGFGKGSATTRTLRRRGRGIIPYGSTDENQFFRGVGLTVSIVPNVELSVFASKNKLDATIVIPDSLDFDQETGISSQSITGLHRTASELAKKNIQTESLAGGAFTVQKGRFMAGVAGYVAKFETPLLPSETPYKRYNFAGDQASMITAFFEAGIKDVNLFGEVARDPNGVFGGIAGLLLPLGSGSEAMFLGRHFPADFTSIHGFAFGERNGNTNNETGFYAGIKTKINREWSISAYHDQFKFPWLRFGVARPTSGNESLVAVTYAPRPWWLLTLQGKTETKEIGTDVTDSAGRTFDSVYDQLRQSLRIQSEYNFNRKLRFRTRVELSNYARGEEDHENGFLMYQDIRLTLAKFRIHTRLAFFDTDSYNSRVYAFENDVRYVLTNPSFSGRGQRYWLLLQYTPAKMMTLWFKYGVTHLEEVKSIGSGLDEVQGNSLHEVRAQVLFRF